MIALVAGEGIPAGFQFINGLWLILAVVGVIAWVNKKSK